ncbi:hypothetical protein [Candidatus Protochlamydia sp. W-9]|nr:hypothetical protein [Candidatus Protochlamydia sp. W-9]
MQASQHLMKLQTLDTVRTFPWKDYQQKLVQFPLINGLLSEGMKLKVSHA